MILYGEFRERSLKNLTAKYLYDVKTRSQIKQIIQKNGTPWFHCYQQKEQMLPIEKL